MAGLEPSTGRLTIDLIWVPVIEHPDAIEPFLLRSPSEMLEADDFHSDIDTLFGFNYGVTPLYTSLTDIGMHFVTNI